MVNETFNELGPHSYLCNLCYNLSCLSLLHELKKIFQRVITCESLTFAFDGLKYGFGKNRYVVKNVVEATGGDFKSKY
jgi:hypothetical protein